MVYKFPISSPNISYNIKKPWLKATLKEIKNLINNHNVLVEDLEKYKPVTPCMDVYKAKIQSDGSLDIWFRIFPFHSRT